MCIVSSSDLPILSKYVIFSIVVLVKLLKETIMAIDLPEIKASPSQVSSGKLWITINFVDFHIFMWFTHFVGFLTSFCIDYLSRSYAKPSLKLILATSCTETSKITLCRNFLRFTHSALCWVFLSILLHNFTKTLLASGSTEISKITLCRNVLVCVHQLGCGACRWYPQKMLSCQKM